MPEEKVTDLNNSELIGAARYCLAGYEETLHNLHSAKDLANKEKGERLSSILYMLSLDLREISDRIKA